MTKFVYTFGDKQAEGDADMKGLLGGKGAGLAKMCRLQLSVPPGFTITTEACKHYFENRELSSDLKKEITRGLDHMERIFGARFGDPKNPLLVSVRSGARASMPGMMDTLLNVGLNGSTLKGLAQSSDNSAFAKECYKRLKETFRDLVGKPLPEQAMDQLLEAIQAVFRSWQSRRASTYRRIHHIPEDWGTACNVQAMVFGNMGEDSATGVAFSRNPSTGEKKLFGEVLFNAQGEDLVAGLRTPQGLDVLKQKLPKSFEELKEICQCLEKHYRDMQDMEFTIQKGKFWMLQTRRGERSIQAAVKIAVDMVSEGLIGKEEALPRVDPYQVELLLHPKIASNVKRHPVAKGLPASPGGAVGRAVFSADESLAWAKKGESVILVRSETSPEDIHGMHVAQGILTARGGMTSHAAVVARGMGKVCVVGCETVEVNPLKREFRVGGMVVREGEWLTLDGSSGEVLLGKLPTESATFSQEFETLLGWADSFRRLKIRTNADTPKDAEQARKFGAEGIGLCRTEHMFFESDRIPAIRRMIVADSLEERREALLKIKPMQKNDFLEIFRVMRGLPVTIRLLDPPLHEFLPTEESEIRFLSEKMEIPFEKLEAKIRGLKEVNPMLGLRGCRLGILYPEIYAMQTESLMEAACELVKEGIEVLPEIEIPLVGFGGEIERLRDLCRSVCEEVIRREGIRVGYKIGTMIEIPRAALRADTLVAHADFFSFGTNDLTQTMLGISRDDGFKFLPHYEKTGLVAKDPFQTLDQEGVGELMKISVRLAREAKPKMEIGICGEHGGDPESIYFCHRIGLDYISCSPYRVPVARLAAARAALLKESELHKDA